MARTGFFETYLEKFKKDKLKQKKKEKANELKEKTNLYHIEKVPILRTCLIYFRTYNYTISETERKEKDMQTYH